jgi:hypothetical protein
MALRGKEDEGGRFFFVNRHIFVFEIISRFIIKNILIQHVRSGIYNAAADRPSTAD